MKDMRLILGCSILLALGVVGICLPPSFAQRAATIRCQIDQSYSHQTAYSSGYEDIDQLQNLFVQTLAAGERQFVGQTGSVKTFFVGSGYPQVWVRDYA